MSARKEGNQRSSLSQNATNHPCAAFSPMLRATKPRPVWNRWFPLLARNSAVPLWRSSSEQGFFRSVLQVDHQRWDQTVADLRHLALSAAHPRSRERFLALHEIADGGCATAVSGRTARRAPTVMGWLHAHKQHGPPAPSDQRRGGPPPLFP